MMVSAKLPLLRVSNLTKKFGALEVLRGIDFEVDEGEVAVIVGPSGSGKSTFVRCINGLERPNRGSIYLDGVRADADNPKTILTLRQQVGMVFQDYALFPHLTVLQNILLAPRLRRLESVEVLRERAMSLLGVVRLLDKAHAYPASLSGGQQQRVAIVRALAMSPRLMLFDEPTSALDPETVVDVLTAMKELAQGGMTMIIVTHEMGFAREVANKLVFMDAGEIVEQGEPADLFDKPQYERTMAFFNAILR